MISFRMATRNIWRRKSRNILTVAAIVLGASLLVGVNIATNGAMAEFSRYIGGFWGETDIFIRYATGEPFDEGNLTIISQVSAIEKYAPRLGYWSTAGQWAVYVNGDANKRAGIVGIAQSDYEYYEYKAFNISHSSDIIGYSVVIGDKIAERDNIEVDDLFNLTVRTTSEISNYTLSAIGIYHPTPPTPPSLDILVELSTAQKMTGLEGKISTILVKVKDPGETMETKDLLQKKLGVEFDVMAPKVEAQRRIQSMLEGFQLGLNIMIMVALLVCGFLVFNTMFMAVKERIYEIGVLRAIGTSRRHIFFVFLEESILLGLAGTGLGILAGLGLSKLFAIVLEQAFQIPKITSLFLTSDAVIAGLAGGLSTVVGGAVYPAISASRINILQALRPQMRAGRQIPNLIPLITGLALSMFGAVQALNIVPFSLPYIDMFLIPLGLVLFAAVLVKKSAKILSNPVTLVSNSIGMLLSKNVSRKLLRNAVSFGMIAISLSFAIMMGGVQMGIVDAVEKGVKEALGSDIMLISNRTLPIAFTDNLTRLEQNEIQSATPMNSYWRGTKVFNGENHSSVGVMVIEPETFPEIIEYQFADSASPQEAFQQLASSNETLIIPEALAHELDVSVGDNLTIMTETEEAKNFTVAGIFTGTTLQFIQFGNRPMSESIIISFKSEGAYFYGRNEARIFFVNLKEEYKNQASEVVRHINDSYPTYGFSERSTTLQDLISNVRTHINQIFSIFLLMLYFAILISTIGIAIIMIVSVTERRREIGLLRTQGMSRNQILGLLLTEASFMGLVGFLIGLPSGLLLLKSVTSTTTIAGFWLPYIVPWPSILQSLAFAFIASLAGALYPALKASRMSITRSLQQR